MKLVGLVATITAIGLLTPSLPQGRVMAGQVWGEPHGGLRIGIAAVNRDSAPSADVQFEVALENTGRRGFGPQPRPHVGEWQGDASFLGPFGPHRSIRADEGSPVFRSKVSGSSRARRRLHRRVASWLRLHNSDNDGPLLESVHEGVGCDTGSWAVSNSGAVPGRGCQDDKSGHARRGTPELLERHCSIESFRVCRARQAALDDSDRHHIVRPGHFSRSPRSLRRCGNVLRQRRSHMPHRSLIVLFAAAMASVSVTAQAQAPAAPPTYDQVVLRTWKGLHDKILAMAKDTQFPDDKLDEKPHPDSHNRCSTNSDTSRSGSNMTSALLRGEKFDYPAREKADAGKPKTRASVVSEIEDAESPPRIHWLNSHPNRCSSAGSITRRSIPASSRPTTAQSASSRQSAANLRRSNASSLAVRPPFERCMGGCRISGDGGGVTLRWRQRRRFWRTPMIRLLAAAVAVWVCSARIASDP